MNLCYGSTALPRLGGMGEDGGHVVGEGVEGAGRWAGGWGGGEGGMVVVLRSSEREQ